MKQEAIDRFYENVKRILAGEQFNYYEAGVSSFFEYLAAEILTDQLEHGVWFDGVKGMQVSKESSTVVKVTGHMYCCHYQDKFWTEPFEAVLSHKADTNKCMPVIIKLGELEGESELFSIEWLSKNT